MLQDLFLNLVAELIGIAVTVFLVDRLISRREKRRWLPSKHLLYAKLLRIVGDLLCRVLPIRLRKVTPEMYEYGGVRAPAIVRIERHEVTPSALVLGIDRDLRIHKRFDIEVLSQSKRRIDGILDRSALLLEPEELALLLKLDERLMASLRTDVDWEDEDGIRDFALYVAQVGLAALDVRLWLERELDRRVTTHEMLREMRDLAGGVPE